MKRLLTLALSLLALNSVGQKNPTDQAKPIVAEGKLLYKMEMASWHGTDLFIENYKDLENIGGYFSYLERDIPKCIFFSRSEVPKVIGTITFDDTYNTKTAKIDLTNRDFTTYELDIFTIRKKALNEINSDTLFKFYKNTKLNLIPLVNKKERKVYVLTGPENHGVVIFGNDYLLTFDRNNELVQKKQLHKNIIPIQYNNVTEPGEEIEGAVHSHLPETGDFMTATDICTLMLYSKFAKWKTHNVISQNYLNIWNCLTEQLTVITRDAFDKINKDQEKSKP